MKEMFRYEDLYDDFDEEDSEDDEDDGEDDEWYSYIDIHLNFSDRVVGDFVLVNYEEELFSGKVRKKDDEGATITCMQISGQN